MTEKKHERLAYRLSDIIARLNDGERLDIHELAAQYKTALRTIQRDLKERLYFLAYSEEGPRYYRLDKNRQGHMNNEDIRRFARYASVQELFPETDRRFYEEKLQQSILVKGFQYENIRARQKEFDQITRAIGEHRRISFQYSKVGSSESKTYHLAPYQLLNKNGIWYLVGTDDDHRQKTYCFSQIRSLTTLVETFTPDPALQDAIKNSDSIYYGNQIKEIIIEISALAAGYFQRRPLLPNQETVRELENGGLLLACKNVNPREVVPIVQYWLPHACIISPAEIRQQMIQTLRDYLKD